MKSKQIFVSFFVLCLPFHFLKPIYELIRFLSFFYTLISLYEPRIFVLMDTIDKFAHSIILPFTSSH